MLLCAVLSYSFLLHLNRLSVMMNKTTAGQKKKKEKVQSRIYEKVEAEDGMCSLAVALLVLRVDN